MTPERGVFSAKLSELESAYARLDSCVRHLQSADAAELKNQLKELDEEDRRCSAALEKRAGRRLPFAAALSSLQLKYVRGVDDLLSSEMDSGISRSDKVDLLQVEIPWNGKVQANAAMVAASSRTKP